MAENSGLNAEVLDTLKGFVLKEVLNSDAARKVSEIMKDRIISQRIEISFKAIFLLLESPDKKDAVLACDKLPFVENKEVRNLDVIFIRALALLYSIPVGDYGMAK